MHLYLAVTPDKLREAAPYTKKLAHVAYRIGGDGHLRRRELSPSVRGGMMSLSDGEGASIADPAALCREIWWECANRDYCAVTADFEQPFSSDRRVLLSHLAAVLEKNGRQLFVPEVYGKSVPSALVLICTALSGGTLRQKLDEAERAYGRERMALDLQRLRMVFPIPCPTGVGSAIDGTQLDAIMAQHRPQIFYSADLWAKYFTFTQDGQRKFLLFDDGDSMLLKIREGQRRAIPYAFLMYPEAQELLPRLFPSSTPR